MYRRHAIMAGFIFALFFIISISIGFRFPERSIGDLVTFFSIVFGFYLTAMSILYGSNFTKRLYKEEDPKKKTQTKLHTLTAYFKISSFASICSIVLLLIAGMLELTKADSAQQPSCNALFSLGKFGVCWVDIFTSIAVGMLATNIFFMTLLFKIFFDAFVEEGRS